MIARSAGLLGALLLLTADGQLRGQCAGHRDAGARPVRYELELRIDYEEEKLAGRVRLGLENRGERSIGRVPLLLYRLMRVESVSEADGTDLDYGQTVVGFADWPQLQVNFVEVALARPIEAGERRALEIHYDGYLLGYAETGMRYVQDRIDRAFTIIRPDAFAYPVVGVPCIGVMRRMGFPTFDYLVAATVPQTLRVVNGGELVDVERDSATVTYTYRSARPAWRIDLAIADYGELTAGANRVFFLPGDSAGALRVRDALRSSLELFEIWFGPSSRTQGLTVIEIPDGWGSQKDETTIIQAAAAFRDPDRAREVYHEVSHFWNVPARDKPSPRWNEGLASFLEYRAVEEIEAKEVLAERFAAVRDRLVEAIERQPKLGDTPMVEYGVQGLTDYSYSVGMMFFALLHRLAGQETFNRIIGGFYRDYEATGATTEDFVGYVKMHAPAQEELLQDWFYTTGWTEVILSYRTLSEGASHYERRR